MKRSKIGLGAILFVLVLNVQAQIKLPKLFSDHMVLQREQSIRVWGWSNSNQAIQVELNDQRQVAQVGEDGSWEAFLPAMSAGGPYSLQVKGDTTYVFQDVWVGDVWIAGGQSNMEWKLSWTVDDWEKEVADSDLPQIRFFDVPNVYSSEVKKDVSGGEWVMANPKTSGEFSAVAWFFAKKNHLEKGVSVGIIESNWGGTPAEAWTTLETVANTTGYDSAAASVADSDIPWDEFIRQNEANEKQKWDLINNQENALATGVQKTDYDDTSWQKVDLPNLEPLTDIAWLRKEFSLDQVPKTLSIYISHIVQNALVFCNGELLWTKTWSDNPTVLTVPTEILKVGKNVLTIRVVNDWDNKAAVGREGEMWMEVDGIRGTLEGEWRYSNEIESKMPEVTNLSWIPSFLYNGMIAPIAGYAVRGVIWYQGESNVGENQYYHELFTHMIEDWRKAWDNPVLAFLYVQLANFQERKEEPEGSAWASLREAQTQTLALPNTGMATIIDIGEALDIHPRNKKDVGMRLWLAAKKVSFQEEVVFSGPMYRSHKIKKDKIIISFDQVQNGFLVKEGESPIGFAIAGSDKKFYWAKAEIKGNQIIVSAPEVSSPVAVRYAWADNPATNLYNREELPAVPFRTDDW